MTSTEDLANDHEQSDTTCVCSRDGDGDEANVGERLIVIGAKKSVEVTCEKKVEAFNALNDEVSSDQKDLSCFDSSRMKNLYDVISDIEDQFIRAYDSRKEVSRMSEARKVHYHSSFTEIKGIFCIFICTLFDAHIAHYNSMKLDEGTKCSH